MKHDRTIGAINTWSGQLLGPLDIFLAIMLGMVLITCVDRVWTNGCWCLFCGVCMVAGLRDNWTWS